ncbi:GNAT family N-acetyltransferase [Draconibacterium mangrovi]|uniref:GNAT family N-acetyltransferase n=1 Tax=Draconibacterium mangrovi TaxID=2697469 RepID=UPI0013D00C1B|nr:GNAT family N-acetyltransferase [Draconibacterium mangrovi]
MKGLQFEWTLNPSNQYFKLRSGVYAYDLRINIPLTDKYDGVSDHLMIRLNDEIIGGARLTISPSDGLPLELETCLLEKIYSKHHLIDFGYGEVTRLFLRKENRTRETVTSIYSMMNSRRKEYGVHYLFSFQPKTQARLTAIICKNLGYETKIYMVDDICKESMYSHLGKIYIIAITNKNDLRWRFHPE